jgi:hypothetical protein
VHGSEVDAQGPRVPARGLREGFQFLQGEVRLAQLQPVLCAAHGQCLAQWQTHGGDLVKAEVQLLGPWPWGSAPAGEEGNADVRPLAAPAHGPNSTR